jgi:hypothetical protein
MTTKHEAYPADPSSTLATVASFALTAYRQDKDRIDPGHEAIKRDTAVRVPPNHQFTPATLAWPADERTVGQDLYRLHDLAQSCGRVVHLEPGHLVEQAIQIVKHFRREFDAGHAAGQRRGLRATGLRGRSPRERTSIHAFASSHGTVFPVASIFAQRASATR